MGKLLRTKDILLLTLAGIGDLFEEIRDPMQIVSNAYKNMYGFVPRRYSRQNFYQAVWRSIRTGDIEKVVKNNKAYLRLTTVGKKRICRDFPLTSFSRQWNKKWVILIFDIEEKSRKLRNVLRTKLKNIGFGMLQQSVWITPLPITKDMIEFIESNNLKERVFVLEVSSVLLGDPKELARKVWNLDRIEEKQIALERRRDEIESSIKFMDGRHNNGEVQGDKIEGDKNGIGKSEFRRLEVERKAIRKRQLELILSLPFLFKELLPDRLAKLF